MREEKTNHLERAGQTTKLTFGERRIKTTTKMNFEKKKNKNKF